MCIQRQQQPQIQTTKCYQGKINLISLSVCEFTTRGVFSNNCHHRIEQQYSIMANVFARETQHSHVSKANCGNKVINWSILVLLNISKDNQKANQIDEDSYSVSCD